MNYTRSMIFPGMMFGCMLVLLLTKWIANPVALVLYHAQEQTDSLTYLGSSNNLSQNYPQSIQQWRQIIERYANKHNLDADLVAAVMSQESGGDPKAYSYSGAVGLMQVMPRDGIAASFICENGPCFTHRPSQQELFDPEYNVSYGCQILSGLIRRYGNLRDALKAYGPMDVGYSYADLVIHIYETHHS